MKQNNNIYTAEEGKLIVRKSDNFVMGPSIDLGTADSIDNYEEREFSKEEIDEFYKKYNIFKPTDETQKEVVEAKE